MTVNEKAFLDMIAWAEIGPKLLAKSDNGYNVLVGSTPDNPILFHSYKDHPRVYHKEMDSTAAGRYQILKRNFDYYKVSLELPDFSPKSQDTIAMQLIRECRAINDINNGCIESAIYKVRSRWASMPGAGYDQPEKYLSDLVKVFIFSGGKVI